jgi:hypothetical protein
MATSNVPVSTLDTILALQLTVAWAGEGRCEPVRLGWWQTDLIDKAGGGDLLARMLPRTHAWASLEAVREAARRVDAQARRGMANPDGVRTLFFLGFELDERLAERLTALKRAGTAPHEALPLPVSFSTLFSADTLTEALRQPGSEGSNYSVAPGGRQLKGTMPMALDVAVRHLAAALIPFPEHYPVPFYRVTS